MAKVQGDLVQGKGSLPVEIRANLASETKKGDWQKVRKNKKNVARDHRTEVIIYAFEMKQKINKSDLPKDEKERLINHIDRKVKHLKNPKGAIVKHYNGLASEIQEAQKALASETSKKTKGSKKSKKSSSSPPPQSMKTEGLDEIAEERIADHEEVVLDNPEAAETGGSEKSGESEASASFEDFDPQEYARLMMEDPEAAMEMLDGMDPKEKTQAMNMGQQYLQQIQRMAQLQSNMMKMMHKTQSSIIRNIR